MWVYCELYELLFYSSSEGDGLISAERHFRKGASCLVRWSLIWVPTALFSSKIILNPSWNRTVRIVSMLVILFIKSWCSPYLSWVRSLLQGIESKRKWLQLLAVAMIPWSYGTTVVSRSPITVFILTYHGIQPVIFVLGTASLRSPSGAVFAVFSSCIMRVVGRSPLSCTSQADFQVTFGSIR
jgi:hypothetical protein